MVKTRKNYYGGNKTRRKYLGVGGETFDQTNQKIIVRFYVKDGKLYMEPPEAAILGKIPKKLFQVSSKDSTGIKDAVEQFTKIYTDIPTTIETAYEQPFEDDNLTTLKQKVIEKLTSLKKEFIKYADAWVGRRSGNSVLEKYAEQLTFMSDAIKNGTNFQYSSTELFDNTFASNNEKLTNLLTRLKTVRSNRFNRSEFVYGSKKELKFRTDIDLPVFLKWLVDKKP
jgi:hypothetical protein